MDKHKDKKCKFYGGEIVSTIPLIIFIIGIVALVINKNASLKTFWIPGLFAFILSFILYNDKKNFGEKCIFYLKSNTLLSCIIIFILAGILANIFKSVGVSNSLLLLISKLNLDSRFFPVIVFAICCIISTSIGTSTGTISLAVPVFLPLTISLNCNPALILGAIVSGSFFGDNLSPISDTTIISINSLKTDKYKTLKHRFNISLFCFCLSCIVYILLGFSMIEKTEFIFEYNGSYTALFMLLVPIIMFIYLSKNQDVISALIISIIFSITISLIFDLINISDLFSKTSYIIGGIESVVGVIIFWIFLFIILGFVEKDILYKIFDKKKRKNSSTIKKNFIGVLVIIFSIVTVSNNTAAMSMMSNFVDKLFVNKTKIEKANIFDGISCAIPGLLPYNTAFMLMVSLAYEFNCLPQNFSILNILPYSVNSIFLLITYTILALYDNKKVDI